ncbi:hypothetical protein L204_106106 [Cryptococcus depauperatus]|nr:hypothetical protein L204_05236 [Cryptococcus depauperatus CBS 7855]
MASTSILGPEKRLKNASKVIKMEEDVLSENVSGSDNESAAGSQSKDDSSNDPSESEDSEQNLENIQPKRNTKERTKSLAPTGSYDKYRPPVGMTELKVKTDFVKSQFEWDALAARQGVELWAIRAPKSLKPTKLSSLSIPMPDKDQPLTGYLKTKSQSYTLRTAGESSKQSTDEEGLDEQGLVNSLAKGSDAKVEELAVEGGEEMSGIRLLVPRVKAHGKLYVAPMAIKRRLLLAPDLDFNSQVDERQREYISTSLTTDVSFTSAVTTVKRLQPTSLLKFRNHAYGFDTPGPEVTSKKVLEQEMEVDSSASLPANYESNKNEKRKKTEDDSPAKTKKKPHKLKGELS